MYIKPLSLRPPIWALALVAAAVLTMLPAAVAAEQISDKINLNGYGRWAYGKTDGNTLSPGSEDGDYDEASFALNVSAQVSERIRIVGQIDIDAEEGAELDLAFAQYRFSDAAVVSAGVVKHAFGISGEVQDVGTLQNFSELARPIYGPTGVVAHGLGGMALSGRHNADSGWGIAYDLYGGELDPENDFLFDELKEDAGFPEIEEEEGTGYRDVLGTRVVLETPVEGLSFGFSGYLGTEEEDGTSVETLGAQLLFQRGGWDVRGEYVDQQPEGGAFELEGFYVEVARRLGANWQLAVRAEEYSGSTTLAELAEFADDPRLDHEAIALGVNYWVSEGLVFRVAMHDVSGLRFVELEEGEEEGELDELEEDTQLFTFGVDFSF